MIYSNERGSVIDAQETKREILLKEISLAMSNTYYFYKYFNKIKQEENFQSREDKINSFILKYNV